MARRTGPAGAVLSGRLRGTATLMRAPRVVPAGLCWLGPFAEHGVEGEAERVLSRCKPERHDLLDRPR